jgi:RNA polymerase sigma factor (sigma-70 family)
LDPELGTPAGEWIESSRLDAAVAQVLRIQGVTDDADVSDLAQEVRIALWEHGLAQRVGIAWITRVARNKCIDLLRNRDRAKQAEQALVVLQPLIREADLDHLFHARASGLSPRLRSFYELHYVQALTEREVATKLGICRASVRWLDHCCRRELLGDRPLADPKLPHVCRSSRHEQFVDRSEALPAAPRGNRSQF